MQNYFALSSAALMMLLVFQYKTQCNFSNDTRHVTLILIVVFTVVISGAEVTADDKKHSVVGGGKEYNNGANTTK